jgi:hypothetical protein
MRSILIILLFICGDAAVAQERKGADVYYYPGNGAVLPSLSSRVFYQGSSNWYGEVRYNYEEEATLACSVGRTFSKEGTWSYAITPVAGLSAGRLQGASFGFNSSLSYNTFSFSSSMQYGLCPGQRKSNLFSWSELNCQMSDHFYAGVTMQQWSSYQLDPTWEPGMQMGVCLGNWTIPLYIFHPSSNQRYFVLGVCREWKR